MIDISKFLDKNGKLSSIKIRHGLKPEMAAALSEAFPDSSCTTESLTALHLGLSSLPRCELCGNKASFLGGGKFSKWCGVSCAASASSAKGAEHHLADPTIRAAIAATVKARYGVDNVRQATEITDKIRQTCVDKWGATTWLGSEEGRTAARAGMLQKFGVSNPSLHPDLKKSSSATLKKNWLQKRLHEISEVAQPLFTEDDWHGSLQPHDWKCMQCSQVFSGFLRDGIPPRCTLCPRQTSSIHQLVIGWLQDAGIEITAINDRRRLDGLEIDILCGNIGIEINGCYWHSLCDKDYHANKSRRAAAAGMRLIHLFEDELLLRPDVIRMRVLALFGHCERIAARQCEVQRVTPSNGRKFLDDHHWSGAGPGARVYYGLFYNGTLRAVMSFGGCRWTQKIEWEILRFASAGQVLGGAAKLFAAFRKEYQPASVLSYSERRWNWDSAVYSSLGFNLDGETPPNYWYVGNPNKWIRESRHTFQRHKIVDESTTHLKEHEIMALKGYRRIWDCGNLRWVWTAQSNEK